MIKLSSKSPPPGIMCLALYEVHTIVQKVLKVDSARYHFAEFKRSHQNGSAQLSGRQRSVWSCQIVLRTRHLLDDERRRGGSCRSIEINDIETRQPGWPLTSAAGSRCSACLSVCVCRCLSTHVVVCLSVSNLLSLSSPRIIDWSQSRDRRSSFLSFLRVSFGNWLRNLPRSV